MCYKTMFFSYSKMPTTYITVGMLETPKEAKWKESTGAKNLNAPSPERLLLRAQWSRSMIYRKSPLKYVVPRTLS